MKWKDATRNIGSVGSILTVLLLFLVSAGVAYGCPEHGSKVVKRTKVVRTNPLMRTTLITYGQCGERAYSSPGRVRYVTMRDDGYYGYAPRYAPVRTVKVRGYYPMSKTRYVAVRNYDSHYDYAPRYVSVRRQPTYADNGYVVMRNKMPRTRYVAVSDYDRDYYVDDRYAPRYVAVRRQPVYNQRYVAVRDFDSDYATPARYVAVRNGNNGCVCPVSNPDDVETVSQARHVVVKSDYIDGTEEVIYANTDYDDTAAYMDFPAESTYKRNVSYVSDDSYRPVTYVAARKVKYVPTYHDNETVEYVTTNSNYVPTYYDREIDDPAILDTSDAAYVAVDDIADACLMPVARRASPVIMRTRAVRYVPVKHVDKYVTVRRSEPTYVATDDELADHYVDDGNQVVETETTYVETEPSQVAETSTVFVEETDSDSVVVVSGTYTLAGANGYRDGFEEGKEDAKDGNGFEPENSGNFRDGNNGYKKAFGDKNGYADAYRDSYLRGYRAGFDSRTYSY